MKPKEKKDKCKHDKESYSSYDRGHLVTICKQCNKIIGRFG